MRASTSLVRHAARLATCGLVVFTGVACSGDDDAVTTATSTTTTQADATVAPPTTPDLTAPVLAAYDAAKQGVDALEPQALQRLIVGLGSATPNQEWNQAMVTAFAASFCNDWASDDSKGDVGPLTEKGKADWAKAIEAPLHITKYTARGAVDWSRQKAHLDELPVPCQ